MKRRVNAIQIAKGRLGCFQALRIASQPAQLTYHGYHHMQVVLLPIRSVPDTMPTSFRGGGLCAAITTLRERADTFTKERRDILRRWVPHWVIVAPRHDARLVFQQIDPYAAKGFDGPEAGRGGRARRSRQRAVE